MTHSSFFFLTPGVSSRPLVPTGAPPIVPRSQPCRHSAVRHQWQRKASHVITRQPRLRPYQPLTIVENSRQKV